MLCFHDQDRFHFHVRADVNWHTCCLKQHVVPEWVLPDFSPLWDDISDGESPFHEDISIQIGPDCIVGMWCIHRDLFCVYCVQAIWRTHSSLKQVQSEYSHNGKRAGMS